MPELSDTLYSNPIYRGLLYGIELEIEAGGLYAIEEHFDEETDEYQNIEPCLPAGWQLREEHSIDGPEVVTIPMTLEQAEMAIDSLFSDVESQGFTPIRTPRGSTHVHVNCQDLTWQQLESTAFAALWAEPFLIEVAGRGRIGNLFALPYSSIPLAWENIVRTLTHKQLIINEDTHYAAVNFNPLCRIGTIEFRMGPSARNAQEAKDWLTLIDVVAKAGRLCLIDAEVPDFIKDFMAALSDQMSPMKLQRCFNLAQRQVQELALRLEVSKGGYGHIAPPPPPTPADTSTGFVSLGNGNFALSNMPASGSGLTEWLASNEMHNMLLNPNPFTEGQ